MQIRKKTYVYVGVSVFFTSIVIYPLSYGFLLPFLEKNSFLRYVGYEIYIPIEYFRRECYPVYWITEKLFVSCGGTSVPYKRTNSGNTILRNITWYDHGQVKTDDLWLGDGFVEARQFYPNGTLRLIMKEEDSMIYYTDGQLAIENNRKIPKVTVYSVDGTIIANGIYKDDYNGRRHRFEGTFLVFDQESRVVHMEEYKQGKKLLEREVPSELAEAYINILLDSSPF